MRSTFLKQAVLALAMGSAFAPLLAQAQAVSPLYVIRTPVPGFVAEAPSDGLLSLSVANLSFQDLLVGAASSSAVLLTNTGGTALTINETLYSGGAGFTLDASSCATSLAPEQSCALGVTFSPNSRGVSSGTVTISYDGSRTQQVSLSGRGLQGLLQASTASLSFDSVLLPDGAVSTRSVTLTNEGDAPVGSISLSAGAPYSVSGTCNSLLAGGSCQVSVQFDPQAVGSFPGTLQVSSPVGNLSVGLAGQGIAASAIAQLLSSSALNFGALTQGEAAVERAVQIRNNGNSTLTITGVSALPAGVSLTGNSCSAIAPAGTCQLTLSMSAASVLSFANAPVSTQGASTNASLSLTGSVAPVPSQVAAIVSGAPANFGSVVQGSGDVVRAVQIRNDGNTPMTLSGVSGLPAGVTLSGNSCSAVAPSGTCTLTLSMSSGAVLALGTPTVTTIGASANASFGLQGAVVAQSSVATVTAGSPIEFGALVQSAATVDRVVSIRNDGNVPLTLSGVSALPSGVSLAGNSCTAIAPAGTCALTLRLVTTSPVSFTAASVSTVGASANATVSLSGSVAAATRIATLTSTASVSFGSVAAGSAVVDRVVTLRNDGNATLALSGFSNLPSAVTVASNGCTAVAPSASCSITLRLATTAALSFTNQSVTTVGGSSNATLSLTGAVTGASAAQITSASPVNFGNVFGTTVADRVVTIRNNGGAAMTISGLTGMPAIMSIIGNACTAVAPGASCNITLRLANGPGTYDFRVPGLTVTTVGAGTNASFIVQGLDVI